MLFAVFNFSDQVQNVSFERGLVTGTYRDFASGKEIELNEKAKLELEPWSYRVFTR